MGGGLGNRWEGYVVGVLVRVRKLHKMLSRSARSGLAQGELEMQCNEGNNGAATSQ